MPRNKAPRIVYRGSVKNLWEVTPPTPARPGRFIFEFTDDYSVFDYGKMPDQLRGKGVSLALMTAWLFERLSDPSAWKSLSRSPVWGQIADPGFRERLRRSPLLKNFKTRGVAHHYRGLLDPAGRRVRTGRLSAPSRRLEVLSVQILKPQRGEWEGNQLWNYSLFHPGRDNFLIPLEVVFRFGTPRGSSLLERARKDPRSLQSLGIDRVDEGRWLSRPVAECFTKLEPSDRLLSLETALNFSGLELQDFLQLFEATFLIALFLQDRFSRAGIELWDGKFEFLRAGRKILLGDAITPDELRLVKDGIQISKEPIRQYYRRRHPEFLEKIAAAKPLAARTGKKIGSILKAQGYHPPRLDPGFQRDLEEMYLGLTTELTGLDILPPHRSLSEVIAAIRNWVE